jgi:amidase
MEEPGDTFATVPEGGLAGRRIAFSPDLGGAVPVETEVADVVMAAAAACETAGAQVEPACPDFAGADDCFRVLRAWQFEAGLGEILDEHADVVRPSLYANMLAGRTLTGPEVGRAAIHRSVLFHRMREFLETYDALLLPVAPLPAFDATWQYPETVAGEAQEDYLGWMRPVCHVTVTGHPAIAVPGGFSATRSPIGVQFVGRHRAETELLAMAAGFEEVTRHADVHPSISG